MPPNGQEGGAAAASVSSIVGTMKDLKTLSENEVAIDGIVYTLEGFDHPGGDAIRLFGGNDVSVQYRMIHPFHSAGVLNKMKAVGVTSKQTDYTFGSAFEKDLKAAVAEIVKPNQRFATPGFWFRCIFYISLYVSLLFSYVYFGSSWKLCFALGVAQAFIGKILPLAKYDVNRCR
jgi:fatty acid desaturase (delta-4 desaturase)